MKNKSLHIGILRLHAIGDCVLASPVVEALRERYPDAKITWIVKSHSAQVVQGLPGLSSTIVWDMSRHRKRTRLQTLLRVRLSGFDAIVDLHTRPQSQSVAPFLQASHATRRIGGTRSAVLSKEHCTELVDEPEIQHLRIACLGRAKPLDIAQDAEERFLPRVPVNDEHRRTIQQFLSQASFNGCRQHIVLNLGGGTVAERKWPLSHFAKLSQLILETFPQAHIIILGGPADTGLLTVFQQELLQVQAGHPAPNQESRIHFGIGTFSLMEVAALAEKCQAFVTTDTGPMHIAAAVGAPIVALFGPTNSITNSPVHKPGAAPIKLIDARDIAGQWPVSLEIIDVERVIKEVLWLCQST